MRARLCVCVKIEFRKKGECHKKAIENVSTTHNVIGAFLYHPFFWHKMIFSFYIRGEKMLELQDFIQPRNDGKAHDYALYFFKI